MKLNRKEIYDKWLANKKEIMFGEYELNIDLNDELDALFLQKAQEELRETPEIVTKGYEDLHELVTGSKKLITYKKTIVFTVRQN